MREGADKQRVVIFHLKGSGDCCFVNSSSRLYEPLSYPLLFPYGTLGWGEDQAGGETAPDQSAPMAGAVAEPRITLMKYARQCMLTEPAVALLGRC